MSETKFGDTLCCCATCGQVYVAETVATEMSRDAAVALGAGRQFRGKPCNGCRANAHWSMYRILVGPLRVPRADADGGPAPAAKPIWACRVCDFVSREPQAIANHRTEFNHPIRPAGPEAQPHEATALKPTPTVAPAAAATATAPSPAPPPAAVSFPAEASDSGEPVAEDR